MNIEITPFQQVLIFISLLLVAPSIFYLVAVVGGNYYPNWVVLFLFLAMAIIAPFMILAHILAVRSPLLLIGIDILVAYGIYYCVYVWNPYPARDVLVYQDDLELFGNVKTYAEEHYALSGEVDNPKKGSKLQHAIALTFNENGDKLIEESIYRQSPFERPRTMTNEYFYNGAGQLMGTNDNVVYTYNDEGRVEKIVEETSSFWKNRRTDHRKETTYYYNDSSHSMVKEEKHRTIQHYSSPDTSYRSEIRKKIFNENGQILYEGEVEEGTFLYDAKYTYNELNQLIFKQKVSYNESETTYEYDNLGHLKREESISFETDKTKPHSRSVIEYDTLGHKVYEQEIWYDYDTNPSNPISSQRQYFSENEYDSFQNLIRKTIFIQENEKAKRPYYLVEIDLTYYEPPMTK